MDELPRTIGKVATRELTAFGISNVGDLTQHSPRELLAIHGVGPKAIRLLSEELASRELAWRDEATNAAQ